MGDRTYNDMTRDFFERYNAKDYTGALEILTREGPNFPQQAALTTYNQACVLSLQNLVPETLALLRQAVDKGYWYSEKTLREDADFSALRGNPDFEALIGVFQALYEAKRARTTTTRMVIEPAPGAAQPYPLLLALHGNQSNAAITLPEWEAAAKAGWLVGVLQSSQIGFTETTFVWDDEAESLNDIEHHRAELMQAHSVDPHRVVLGGFSMGGRLAPHFALTQPFPIQGFIGVGPYVTGKLDEWQPLLAAAAERGTRGYLVIGDADQGSYEDTLRFADMLKAAGVPCQLKVYPGMGHVYPTDFADILTEALTFISAGEPVVAK